MTTDAWKKFEREAGEAFGGRGRFPVRAYSEFMPSPFVGFKPYRPQLEGHATTFSATPNALDIDEYEQHFDLTPGLDHIADRLMGELTKLMSGKAHGLSATLLQDNPAWPPELAAAALAGELKDEPLVLALALALSRTQDDKGNNRWTLFGTSHDGPAAAFWRSCDDARLEALMKFAGVKGSWRLFGHGIPEALQPLRLEGEVNGHEAIFTFEPFTTLPAPIRSAYLARTLRIVPSPASLVWFEHSQYQKLAQQLPRATQIPLLHLFPRVERSCAIRIPQSGWLDEDENSGHRVVKHLVRTHRWERVSKHDAVESHSGDGKYTDEVSVALFSTDPEDLGLYGKPMARNVEIWTGDYALLLDGPHAARAAIDHAAGVVDAGGRFGYRMAYPPMRAGARELFWHLPLIARREGAEVTRMPDAPIGYVSAELQANEPILLTPHLLARPAHHVAATQFPIDPGLKRHTTSNNARKLLEFRELLGEALSPSFARSLLRAGKTTSLETWLAHLAGSATDAALGAKLRDELRTCIAPAPSRREPIVLGRFGTREIEEQIWHTISSLAEGEFRQKSNADGVAINAHKHGGKAGKKAHVHVGNRRDLDALADHFHARYRELIAKNGMTGKAEVVDHVFRWETDFEFPWMGGWAANEQQPSERNVVCMIPGKNRGEAVIMGDHYDTAYMEDVYDSEVGGDELRAPAQGADDNHSASTALLLAAEHLLPLSRAGKLERDVWLVHLTGEEFPSDSLGARAICEELVEGRLGFTAEDGARRDVSKVQLMGVYVLDMIGHNTERERDVFQIAPGEGAGAARLALRAHEANERWNRCCAAWNEQGDRRGLGRAQRMPDGKKPPPPFAHLPLHGEVRVEWEAASALYNTDGQVFSDVGVPVVLFMENYDISRTGYHDTHDTMENIDLDYCAAMTAIAIEAVADAACAP